MRMILFLQLEERDQRYRELVMNVGERKSDAMPMNLEMKIYAQTVKELVFTVNLAGNL